MNEEQWQAVVACDAAYDGVFFYAVASTRIFCRPSCRSRTPSRSNVSVFANREEALAEGYRPCKRCKPDELALPGEAWVDRIAAWIERRFADSFTLRTLAEEMHGSPYHLQRTFKQLRGVTPAQYATKLRVERAKALLAETELPVADVAAAVGIANAAYFATVFQSQTGLSPTRYRRTHGVSGPLRIEEGIRHDATIPIATSR